ncbi:MAG: alpha-L-fucosidase, partial [Phycisphaerae bacterium]|nr:alpha-L-fucosidase [Phycisphaerae bacterium]
MAKRVTQYQERMRWFHKARFGMFIHWGLYSIPGNGEWWMFSNRIPRSDYEKLADRFNPTKFDADAWAGLAAEAGMKYMVLTSRHHDGFCLFDSQVSDFTSVKRRARRDFVAEYTTACRKAGLKVGLYYSLLDWRFPGYFQRDKYLDSSEAMAQQFRDQVRELMTQYGKIDLLWYDGGWIGTEVEHFDFDDMSELHKFWRSKKVNAMARKLQPGIIINNRSGVDEDIDTPEHHITASAKGRGWESCGTIGDTCGWGYVRHNPNWSTVPTLLQNLVTCTAGQGNYLLNVGPSPLGVIRREEVVRLRAMGDWLRRMGWQGVDAITAMNRPLLKIALHRCTHVTLDIDATLCASSN